MFSSVNAGRKCLLYGRNYCYLRHDVVIAYEMARAMTKSSRPTPCRRESDAAYGLVRRLFFAGDAVRKGPVNIISVHIIIYINVCLYKYKFKMMSRKTTNTVPTWDKINFLLCFVLIMTVEVTIFHNFAWSSFLIIRQNVNMTTNAIAYCGLASTNASSMATYDTRVVPTNLGFRNLRCRSLEINTHTTSEISGRRIHDIDTNASEPVGGTNAARCSAYILTRPVVVHTHDISPSSPL